MQNQFEHNIIDLFKDCQFLPNNLNQPIMIGKLPNEIVSEIDIFTSLCRQIKNHKLSFLKNHTNVGKNKFQVSVPTSVFEDSFTCAYLIHMGEYFLSKITTSTLSELSIQRVVRFRKNDHHFDGYDFWINFIEPGDYNDWHNHAGSLSGVIYVDNSIGYPTKFKDGTSFNGSRGDIILFPSSVVHSVDKNTTQDTRLTYAFNLDILRSHNV